nr:MAG: ORF1 [TTV-like mini virus]
MARYWNNFYNTYRQRRRRRRRIFRRRPRQTFRTRKRRRRTVRKRKTYRKKLKKIILKEWQPTHIKKCKIKGNIQLFVCGKTRLGFDYTNYKESTTPIGEASGGPFSIQMFSLDALYTEFIKHRAIWTRSNQGLPLARFTGATLKLYKSLYTDYIVTYSRCPPFSVTYDMYMNSQPIRQLLQKHKVIVPRLTNSSKKRYKKIKIRPPAFMQTKWYFQQDICKTGLLLVTATACSLDQPYIPENQVSNNYTLYSLNTDFFQNPCFEKWGTRGYQAKQVGTEHFYIFGDTVTHTDPHKTPIWNQLFPLTNTNQYGHPNTKHTSTIDDFTITSSTMNVFASYVTGAHTDMHTYIGTQWPTANTMTQSSNTTLFTDIYWECRYNAERDTGIGNKVYFKSNNDEEQGDIYTYPKKPELMIENFPLWLIFWGWIDFLAKSAAMQEMYSHWFFVVESPFIYPKKKRYLFLDQYFVKPKDSILNERDKLKWHPKFEQQTEVVNFFAESGPFSPKINRSESIQADMDYSFYFKWGGCPANMDSIISPCQQDRFPIPNKGLSGLEIQDPKTSKLHYLYSFDERHEMLTKRCLKRLKKDSDSELCLTGTSKLCPPLQAQQTEEDSSQEEKETQTQIQNQLLQLQLQQQLFQQQLLRIKQLQKLE